MALFPEFRRRQTIALFVCAAEMGAVVVADDFTYFLQSIAGGFQKRFTVFQFLLLNEFTEGNARLSVNHFAQKGRTVMKSSRQFRQRNAGIILPDVFQQYQTAKFGIFCGGSAGTGVIFLAVPVEIVKKQSGDTDTVAVAAEIPAAGFPKKHLHPALNLPGCSG